MENFEVWLQELKEGVKENNIVKVEKAETELKNFYGMAIMQNEHFRNEIEDLKCRLED